MRGPIRFSLAAFAAGLIAGASTARAEGPAFLSPAGSARLLSGSTVTVEWSKGAMPGDEVGEMELVLSLDGGRSFDVRVSGEIEPDVGRIDWRVPSLPARHARLALRTGNGTRDSEAIRIVSAEFEILRDSDTAEEPFLRIDGEWRTRDALLVPQSRPSPPRALEAEPALFARDASQAVGAPPRTDPLEKPLPVSSGPHVCAGATPPSTAARPLLIRLAPLPLRE